MSNIVITGILSIITFACITIFPYYIYKRTKRNKELINKTLNEQDTDDETGVTYHCSLNDIFGYDIIQLQQPFNSNSKENMEEQDPDRYNEFSLTAGRNPELKPLSGSSINNKPQQEIETPITPKETTATKPPVNTPERHKPPHTTSHTTKPIPKPKPAVKPDKSENNKDEAITKTQESIILDDIPEEKKKLEKQITNFPNIWDTYDQDNFDDFDSYALENFLHNSYREEIKAENIPTQNDQDNSTENKTDKENKTETPSDNHINDLEKYKDILKAEVNVYNDMLIQEPTHDQDDMVEMFGTNLEEERKKAKEENLTIRN